jgi:hypothetical protein
LNNYNVNIRRVNKRNLCRGSIAEIWADITNKENYTTMKKRIWWQDDNGIQHDGTPNLPIEVRNAVDNAWLEKKRHW